MRLPAFILCLMLCGLLLGMAGCASTPWHKPGVENNAQASGQFEVDSGDCDLEARDEYPIDKDGQKRVYDACMEKKGWSKRDGSNPVNFR